MAGYEKVKHHCEVVSDEEQCDKKWNSCKMKHDGFFQVDGFSMEHLPEKYRTQEVMDSIKNQIDRTVKISLFHISVKRPETFPKSTTPYPLSEHRGTRTKCFFGTGYIELVLDTCRPGPCPCPECKNSNQPKMEFWVVVVVTATHVVFDRREAKSIVVDLFYDREDREGVRYLYGLYARSDKNYETDKCEIVCFTHEKDVIERLKSLCNDSKRLSSCFSRNEMFRIMVSHPHGFYKKISLGKHLEKNFDVKPGCSVTIPKNTHVTFPRSDHTQEHTLDSDLGEPAVKRIKVSSKNKGDENSKSNKVVNLQETISSRSYYKELITFLTPTANRKGFKLKFALGAFIPRLSVITESLQSKGIYTMPANTKYVSPDGKTTIVPTEIKLISRIPLFYQCDMFLKYDMACCPGSSGAYVDGLDFFEKSWTHFGFVGGKGQSGVVEGFDFDEFDDYFDWSDDDSDGDDDSEDV